MSAGQKVSCKTNECQVGGLEKTTITDDCPDPVQYERVLRKHINWKVSQTKWNNPGLFGNLALWNIDLHF